MSEEQATPQAANQERSYRRISGLGESLQAIEEVIALAKTNLRIFDMTLTGRGFNSPARIDALRALIAAGRAHHIQIALHDTAPVERDCPRLVALLRQFPMSIEIHRTLGQAREATDPFVLADDHSVWRQMHFEQPRAIVALHSPQDTTPILQRFEEIWELSEPAVSATKPGL